MKETIDRMQEKSAMLEAILFTTDRPLSVKQICKKLRVRESTAEKILKALKEKYSDPKHGITLQDIGGYRLTVKEKYAEHVHDLTPHADMSRGLLRVLAIISFHEPVKQSDIVKVIGNRTYDYVKELKDRGLILIEKAGRTRIIETSPRFEEYFGIKKSELKKMLGNKLQDTKETENAESDSDDRRDAGKKGDRREGTEDKKSHERTGSEVSD